MILIVVTFCLSNFMIYRLSKNLKEQINLHNIRSETKTRIEGLKELSFNDFLQRIFVYGRVSHQTSLVVNEQDCFFFKNIYAKGHKNINQTKRLCYLLAHWSLRGKE